MRTFVFLFLALPGMTSCTSSLWGIPLEDWSRAKLSGDFSFLRTLELSPGPLPDLSFLGGGATYSLGILLEKEGRDEDSVRFLTASMEREAEPFSSWAYHRLGAWFTQKGDWVSLESLSRKYLDLKPGDLSGRRNLAEALYWQKKDVEVLFRIQAGQWGGLENSSLRELDLFRAVSALRADHPDSGELWKQFLRGQPASSLHYRAYTFFEEDPVRYEKISPYDQKLLLFKAMVGERRSEEAWKIYRELKNLPSFQPDRLLLGDLGRILQGVPEVSQALKDLGDLSGVVAPQDQGLLLQFQSRLVLRQGQRKSAGDLLRRALNSTREETDRKNILLELLELYRIHDREKFAETLEEWGSPDILSSLGGRKLDDFRASLLRDRRWDLLHRVWRVLAFQAPPAMKASWASVMVRLDQTGLLPTSLKIGDPASLVRQIREWDPLGYSSLVLSDLEGFSWKIPMEERTSPSGEESPLEKAYGDLVSFGLAFHAYEKFWNSGETESSLESLKALAQALAVRGYFLESQRIMIRAARRYSSYGEEEWKLRYPLAFDREIRESAAAAGISQELFRALVREESFYDPEISSPVGARGLSQLMPATAQAMLEKLRMDRNAPLTDPEINLKVGSKYLAERMRDFHSPAKALMAYNGGQGRVRTWNREFGFLPPDLFVEACPLEETRNYVKKIYVTASFYRKLYQSSTPAAELIYPGLKQ